MVLSPLLVTVFVMVTTQSGISALVNNTLSSIFLNQRDRTWEDDYCERDWRNRLQAKVIGDAAVDPAVAACWKAVGEG